MKLYTSKRHHLVKLIFLVSHFMDCLQLELQIKPSTVVTSNTNIIATVQSQGNAPSAYKFSFGRWRFQTPQAKVVHKFSQPGKYEFKASALVNSTWSKWLSKEILVFDHKTALASRCSMNVTYFGLIVNKTNQKVPQGSTLSAHISLMFHECLGRCNITFRQKPISTGKINIGRVYQYIEMVSYGAKEEQHGYFNVSKCSSVDAHLEFLTPLTTIVQNRTLKTSNLSQCTAKSQAKTPGYQNLQPNTIVAVFYVLLLLMYVVDFFIAYQGTKHLFKPAQDLMNKEDDHIYEVRIHVGSGLSIKSTKCKVHLTIYGSLDTIGPFHLPVASFEEDGIASFLVSTSKAIGSVVTVGIFCKNMDLSSDWYLRKVDIYQHSEKPDGALWSDEDIITRSAKFECHTWFSPGINPHSIAQVFHQSTDRLRQSLAIDYFSRCKQLFLQKHLATSWTCCYGVQSFTKLQRLALLFSIWLALTCLSTIFFQFNDWKKETYAGQFLHIGIIRLNTFTVVFAFTSATVVYMAAALLSTAVRMVHFQRNTATNRRQIFRPMHIDVVRSRPVDGRRAVTFEGSDDQQQNGWQKVEQKHQRNGLSNLCEKESGKCMPEINGVHVFTSPRLSAPIENDIYRANDGHRQVCSSTLDEGTYKEQEKLQSTDEISETSSPRISRTTTNADRLNDGRGEFERYKLGNSGMNDTTPSSDVPDQSENDVNFKYHTWMDSENTEVSQENIYPQQSEARMAGNESTSFNSNHDFSKNVDSDNIIIDIDDDMVGSKYSGDLDRSNENDKRHMSNGLINMAYEDQDDQVHSSTSHPAVPLSSNTTDYDSSGDDQINATNHQGENETDGNVLTACDKANDFINNNQQVQFLNRETLPTKKENKLKVFIQRLIFLGSWILHFLLLSFSVLYSLINSAPWSNDMAYHWVSMCTLAMTVCCCLIDTIRVLLYIFIITINERRKLKKIERETNFRRHSENLLASRRAEFENREFFKKEFPKEKLMLVKTHYRLQGKVKDFLIFALFLAVLLILTTWTMNSNSFRFWKSLENNLFKYKKLLVIQRTKGSVDPVANFWKWLRTVAPQILNSTQRDVSNKQLHVIGKAMNIIQKRVQRGKCSVPHRMKTLIGECNAAFSKELEDRSSYSKGWSLPDNDSNSSIGPWDFQQNILFNYTTDIKNTYSEGYVAKLNSTNVNQTIDELSKSKWIDQYTRIVHIETFVYEPSSQFLTPALLVLEFTTSGLIKIRDNLHSFVLFQDLTPEHKYVQFAELIFFVMTFYFIYDIFTRKKRTSTTWFSGWLLIEASAILLSFAVLALFAWKNILVHSLKRGTFQSTVHVIAFYQIVLEQIMAALNFLSITLLMKPIFTLGLIDDMYLAVIKTLRDMKGIALETFVLVIAFMFWARAAFVANIKQFSSLEGTFPTLIDMLVRPDNEDLYTYDIWGPLLLLTYYCMLTLLVSNIFISAVQQSYSTARRAFENAQRGTVLQYIVKSLNKKGKKRLLKDGFSKKFGTLRRTTNLKGLENLDALDSSMSSINDKNAATASPITQDELSETRLESVDKLLSAVEKLEKYTRSRITNEDIEDRVLVSAISNGWKKVVEKKPAMNIIALYKQRLRR